MATLREIKRRIVGVKSTEQITNAMKMVAAARLRRAQENIINARPYTRKISEVLAHLVSLEQDIDNPLLEKRELNSMAIVVVTSDRGLCGSFNMNVIRQAEELAVNEFKDLYDKGGIQLYCVGKKGHDYFKSRNFNITGAYPGIFSKLEFPFASGLMTELSNKFINGEIDRVLLIYNQFKSVIQQILTTEQLLPVKPLAKQNEMVDTSFAEYIYEPDKSSIIDTLIPRYLNALVWKALLESYAAELGARMTAMDMATENAKEMIRSLQLKYNKERQAAITKEILEIVSGANALKKS
jgi:F-type H+-transporting ATPase subunit gamma